MKLFAANWKMYLSDDAAVALASEAADAAETANAEVVIAPGFTGLREVGLAIHGSKVALAAQDGFWEDKGAYTGEISMAALAHLEVRYVIIGHSERRQYFGETDAMVAKKTAAALKAGLTPIVCVGETKEERDAGQRDDVVRRQLKDGLTGVDLTHANIVIAYEPRWAIGTGVACAPEDARETHRLIHTLVPDGTRVLYGGSVDPTNIASYIAMREIDGTLVGGASTDATKLRAMLAAF